MTTHSDANNEKRDKIPVTHLLQQANPHLIQTYQHYESHAVLGRDLFDSATARFSQLNQSPNFPTDLAASVIDFMDYIAVNRSIVRVDSF